MMEKFKDEILFDAYLGDEMTSIDKAAFEKRLLTEAELKEAFELHRSVLKSLNGVPEREQLSTQIRSIRKEMLAKQAAKNRKVRMLFVALIAVAAILFWYFQFSKSTKGGVDPEPKVAVYADVETFPLIGKDSIASLELRANEITSVQYIPFFIKENQDESFRYQYTENLVRLFFPPSIVSSLFNRDIPSMSLDFDNNNVTDAVLFKVASEVKLFDHLGVEPARVALMSTYEKQYLLINTSFFEIRLTEENELRLLLASALTTSERERLLEIK